MHHLTGSATSLRLGNGRVEYRAVGSDELVGRFDPSRPLGRDWNLIRLQETAPGAFIFASNCWAQTRPRPAVGGYPADEDCPYTPLNTPNIELLDGIEVLEYPRYYYQGPEPLWACAPGFEGPERIGAIIRMGFYAYYIMRLPSIRPGEAPTLGGGC